MEQIRSTAKKWASQELETDFKGSWRPAPDRAWPSAA